jgi:hypothetical protein
VAAKCHVHLLYGPGDATPKIRYPENVFSKTRAKLAAVPFRPDAEVRLDEMPGYLAGKAFVEPGSATGVAGVVA